MVGLATALTVWSASVWNSAGAAELAEGEEEEVLEDHTRLAPRPVPPKPSVAPPAKADRDAEPVKPRRTDESPKSDGPPKSDASADSDESVAPTKSGRADKSARSDRSENVTPRATEARTSSLFLHLYVGEGVPRAFAERAATSLASGVDAARFVVSDLDSHMLALAGVNKLLAGGDRALDRAETAFNESNLEGVFAGIAAAVPIYEAHLLALMERDGSLAKLRDAFRIRSVTSFLDGNEDAARADLDRVFVLQPDLDFDPKLFPSDMESIVTEQRLLFDELGTGSVEVSAKLAGIAVYLNGKLAGVAPLKVQDLRVGPTYVTLATPGHPASTKSVMIEGARSIVFTDEPVAWMGPLPELLGEARTEVGRKAFGRKLRALAGEVGTPELLLLARAERSPGEVSVQAFLYDTKSGRLVNQAEVSAAPDELARAVQELSVSVLAESLRVPDREQPRPGPRPWKHRYFWPAVGATATVTALVVGIVAAVSAGDDLGRRVVILGLSF